MTGIRQTQIKNWKPSPQGYFEAMYDQVPLPVWLCQPHTLRIEDANPAAQAMLDYSPREWRRLHLADLIPGHSAAALRRSISQGLPAWRADCAAFRVKGCPRFSANAEVLEL